MQLKKSILGSFITLATSTLTNVAANEISVDQSKLSSKGSALQVKKDN